MGDGDPEGLDRLPAQGPSGGIGDGPRDHDGQPDIPFLEQLIDGKDGCLGIQGVEDGLDQEDVHPSVNEAPGLVVIGQPQLIKSDGPVTRIIDIRGEGQGPVGGTQGAGHETGFFRPVVGRLVSRFPGQGSRGDIDLIGQVFHAIIGHGNSIGVEGIGLQDIRSGGQVLLMDPANDLRLRQAEQVIVALEVPVPIAESLPPIGCLIQLMALDHRPHGPVQDEDTLLDRFG